MAHALVWRSSYLIFLGVLVAWMLVSNGTKDVISFFLRWVWARNPSVSLAVILTDCDLVQIRALEIVYPASRIFLCQWHVLRAMRSHFNTNEFSDLWIKVKDLVQTPDEAMFKRLWAEISSDPSVPQSFIEYMASERLPDKESWAKAHRQGLSIFEESDTNMLIEAYVVFHFLEWVDDNG
jgi:hypothetical protein